MSDSPLDPRNRVHPADLRRGADAARLAAARALWTRYGWLRKIRPASLGCLMRRLLVDDRRMIVSTKDGARLFVDPLSNLGSAIVLDGEFEPETAAHFRKCVRPGSTVWDVGANEGYFSVLAARLAGPSGVVAAIEPQTRLRDVIDLNLALNSIESCVVVHAAMAKRSGERVCLNLSPDMNSGSSSIVVKYRWSTSAEEVPTVTPESVIEATGRDSVDFVKIDVEGFESQIVPALEPLIRAKRIHQLLLDYHAPQLAAQGLSAVDLHTQLLAWGLHAATPFRESSYVLYEVS